MADVARDSPASRMIAPGMRLEIGSVGVRDLAANRGTRLDGRTLCVDLAELRDLALEDRRFVDVEVHLARPGESVRIVHALDVVEPCWKVGGPGGVFPGFVSPTTGVGEGRTQRLAGVAVVPTGDPVPGEATHFREHLIDMAGPGADLSPFAHTLHVVLRFRANLDRFPPGSAALTDGIVGSPDAIEYNRGVMQATLKVAARLGRVVERVEPDEVEAFALPPCDPALPRVLCVTQFLSHVPFLYGLRAAVPLGALVHPNECFDGALVRWPGAFLGGTYFEQNGEILKSLCRRHGSDLAFVGYLVWGGPTPYREDKERAASAVVRLARLLQARAVVFLGSNGSNHAVDLMLAIQKCERAGIATVLVYNDVGAGADDPGFIFAVPEADAIVSAGARDLTVELPALAQVIGGERLVAPDLDPWSDVTVPLRYLFGATDVQGHNRLTTRFA